MSDLIYNESFPIIMMTPSGSGINGEDSRLGFASHYAYYFEDESSNRISDTLNTIYPAVPIEVFESGLVTGWPVRRTRFTYGLVDLWGNTGETQSEWINNPAPPSGELQIINAYPNSFVCSIDPFSPIDEYDFSGHYFWIDADGGSVRPNDITTIAYGMNSARVAHGLNATGNISVWYATVDTFSSDPSGLNINGPFTFGLAGSADLGSPSNLDLTLSGFVDNYNNEHNALVATWGRATGDLTQGYDVMFLDSSGMDYHFNVVQTPSGEDPKYVWTSPVPDRDYEFRLRGYSSDGRKDIWTPYSSPVTVPKNRIRFLHVEGKSRFQDVTYVDVESNTIGGAVNLDCSLSNIFVLSLSSSVTLTPTNTQVGATYLFIVNGSSQEVNFSSDWYFPSSQSVPITVDGTSIISAECHTSGSLHAVYNQDFTQVS